MTGWKEGPFIILFRDLRRLHGVMAASNIARCLVCIVDVASCRISRWSRVASVSCACSRWSCFWALSLHLTVSYL